MISEESGRFLLGTTRTALHQFLRHRRVMDRPEKYPTDLDRPAGIFMELHKHVPGAGSRESRGSAGSLELGKPLLDNAINCSIALAKDKNYPEIETHELPVMDIELSVIEGLENISSRSLRGYIDAIELGKDGLVLKKGIRAGVLMPKVPLEKKWTVKECLGKLCEKAGLPEEGWSRPGTKIYKFRPQVFREIK